MKRTRILLLAGNTLRARSYAQQLKLADNVEVYGLFYGFNSSVCEVPALNEATEDYLKKSKILIPDFSETLEETFIKKNWEFQQLETRDVNDPSVIKAIAEFSVDVIVFCGYGGQILKSDHFLSTTPYLHMHPGLLPIERGSTTIYYSILLERKCTVTAFLMTAEIDAGDHICRKQYEIPGKNVDIDRYFDNCVRADCFLHAIQNFETRLEKRENLKSEEFYIIHPVLKHIALLSLK